LPNGLHLLATYHPSLQNTNGEADQGDVSEDLSADARADGALGGLSAPSRAIRPGGRYRRFLLRIVSCRTGSGLARGAWCL
jgi:hypothetical protein